MSPDDSGNGELPVTQPPLEAPMSIYLTPEAIEALTAQFDELELGEIRGGHRPRRWDY